ncbi:MAG: hypothetical protein U0L26_10420 [Cellulosilyticum sp.]|nr:hypothetical protein [Cellulosilyticum sp.]MEE1072772.1 hypothetical protein [Cellulosilyticum sp.]
MTKRRLDLSHTLAPLDNELQDILRELIALKEEDSPLFSAAIDDFITKYGGTKYTSLEDLLASSAAQASYTSKESVTSLDELLKDLLP